MSASGEISSSVYWRRRALVAVPLVVILAVFATCMVRADGSTDGAAEGDVKSTPSPSSAPPPQKKTPGKQDGTLEHPYYPVPGPSPGAEAEEEEKKEEQKPAPAVQESAAPVDCQDSELSIVVKPEHTVYPAGSRLKVRMEITNISERECIRDVGAGAQEMFAQSGEAVVWSSDHCSQDKSVNKQTLSSGEKLNYWVVWDGRKSSDGCQSRVVVPAGDYDLYGRVGSAKSKEARVTLR